jgi:hypothetical protein
MIEMLVIAIAFRCYRFTCAANSDQITSAINYTTHLPNERISKSHNKRGYASVTSQRWSSPFMVATQISLPSGLKSNDKTSLLCSKTSPFVVLENKSCTRTVLSHDPEAKKPYGRHETSERGEI